MHSAGNTGARRAATGIMHPDVPTILTINPDGKSAHRYQVRLLLEFVEEYGLHMGS